MAITYKSQGAGVSTETSAAALSPACPATVDAGDILILHVFWEATTSAPSPPGAWTILGSSPYVIETTIGRHWVYGKIADGTEDNAAQACGAPAVTTQRAARIYSFAGRVSGTITQLVKGFSHQSHATDPQMPTVTTTQAGALAVALVAQNDNNTFASATGESGGDWVEAVAEYTAALTPGFSLGIQTCTPTANPGTVSGGSDATVNDPVGAIGFQILPSPDVVDESNSDTVVFTEAHTELVSKTRGDSVSLTEAHQESVSKTRGDSVSLTESFLATRIAEKFIGDTISFVEGFTKRVNNALAETVALTEARVLSVVKSRSETLGLTEAFETVRAKFSALGDTLGVTEALRKFITRRSAETVSLTESLDDTFVPGAPASGYALGHSLPTPVMAFHCSIGMRM